MELYYTFVCFIFGTILGSFYNVVGYRLPKGESLLYPASHCTNCNHRLTPFELIPIFSFLLQGGKCTNCNKKISWFYPIFEMSSGILFALSYLIFGFSIEFVIAISFISMLLIIVLSDYEYMIIPDEVLIFFGLLLSIEIGIGYGWKILFFQIGQGILSFILMFLIKQFGNALFKKESMGDGDIKLMAVFGLVLGFPMAMISIFIGSFIGLPISIVLLKKKSTHIIPFGPFLSAGALIILLAQINLDWVVRLMGY